MKIISSILFLICFSSISFAGTLTDALQISGSGVKAQSERMKIVAQNIANVDSTATEPGQDPYRRKIITFKNKKDPVTGAEIVVVDKIGRDYKADFEYRYDPYHPAANEEGYVKISNVKKSIEKLDMKEAELGHRANLGAIETTKSMYMSTIDLLR